MIERLIFDIDGNLTTGINFSTYVTNALSRFGIDDLNKKNLSKLGGLL